jgi:fatty-acyl-CoA synthase
MALHCYETLLAEADEDLVWPELDERSASSLCYTSGTTGPPKGVLYSHRSTVLHAWGVNTADMFGLRAVDRVLPAVPMFHVNAWGLPYAAPMVGAALVLPGPRLDGPGLQALLTEERVTMAAGVPTVWLNLLHHLRASGAKLDGVGRLVIGGSACPALLIEAYEREHGVRVDHAWGMTELSPVGAYNRPRPGAPQDADGAALAHRLKQGRACFGIDLEVVDPAGRPLPWDGTSQGDLLVRGPWVCSAYYRDPDRTSFTADGWLRTGDVVTIDPHGFMAITDRTKDVIKSGGEWISSIALENIALAHPAVREAAVIAARHPKWDERPLLLVVPQPGADPDPAELLAAFTGKVARWWIPDAVLIVAELPHTATGKLAKRALRETYGDFYLRERA